MTRAWIALSSLCLFACAGQPGPSASETGDTGPSETGDPDSGETGDPGPLLVGEPSIIHHPKQPMIVDVIVELDAPGTGTLSHSSDPGVRVFQLDPAPGEAATTLHFRVRGLLPDASHGLTLELSSADGERTSSWTGELTTNPPLPGFIATFVIDNDDPSLVSDDLRLFDLSRLFSTEPSGMYLVDNQGRTRWYYGEDDDFTQLEDIWSAIALRPDGSLSFSRHYTSWIIDELGEVQMQVSGESLGYPGGTHHDLIELQNGNFMTIAYTFGDAYYEGEGTLHIAGDAIVEFTPSGQVVWAWDSFDHLDTQRRRDGFYIPQKIYDPVTDQDAYDWTHANGIVYDEAQGIVYICFRHQDWIVAIDHATGEILWRLGDEGDFELVGDEYWFFHQHSPQWQPDGSLLLYDNAVGNPERPDSQAHSRAVRYQLDYDAMTATKVWADDDPFFTSALAGDADLMSNGSILRLDSIVVERGVPMARIHELDPTRTPNRVWSLHAPPQRFGYRAVPVTRWVGEPE
jgi:hypothetical protein